MKSILYLYHTSAVGGGSYCLLNILKTVDRALFKPIVLLKENGPLVDEIKQLNIPVYFLNKMSTVPYNCSTFTPKKIRNAFNIIHSLRAYKKLLEELKPDIVYINTMMLYPYLRLAKKHGIKTVIHIREHWPKGEHYVQRKIALNYIDQYADHIVAINQYSASMLAFSNKPKTVVYDWIDLSCRYEECPLSSIFNEDMSGKKVYLYMGGMQVIKGTLQVISAFSESIHDSSARLLVMGVKVGAYNVGWRKNIKKILSCLGRPAYTEQVQSAIERDKRIRCIPSRYKINHIIEQTYCILSYFTIPHANLALAESIILGTPSIAARTSESMEYSLNGSMASLFKINDYEEFKNCIRKFPKERPQIIENIKEHSIEISKMFDPITNSNKLNEIYKTI